MRRLTLAALCLALFAVAAPGQPPDKAQRVKQLQAEIEQTRAKLQQLEKELADLAPRRVYEYLDQITQLDFRVDQVGYLPKDTSSAHFEVDRILGPRSMLVRGVNGRSRARRPFLIEGVSTEGLADGQNSHVGGERFHVRGTRQIDGETYFVLVPAPGFGPPPP